MFIQMKKHFCLQFLLFIFLPLCLQANEKSLECQIAMDSEKVGNFLSCTDEARSQGNTETCVGFAFMRVAEHFYNINHNTNRDQQKKTFNEYYFAKRAYYSRLLKAVMENNESLVKWRSYNNTDVILKNKYVQPNIDESQALDLFELLHIFNHSGFVVESNKTSRLMIESMKIVDPRFHKQATRNMLIANYDSFKPEKSSFEIVLDKIYVPKIKNVEYEDLVEKMTREDVVHITNEIDSWSGENKKKHYFLEDNIIMSTEVNTVSENIAEAVESFSNILDNQSLNKAYIVLTTDQDGNAHAIVFLGKKGDKYVFKNSWKDQPELSLTKNQVDGLFLYDNGGSDATSSGKFEKIYAMYELSSRPKK